MGIGGLWVDDDWDVEPKKNTKPVYGILSGQGKWWWVDDWDDEPTTKKSTPVDGMLLIVLDMDRWWLGCGAQEEYSRYGYWLLL